MTIRKKESIKNTDFINSNLQVPANKLFTAFWVARVACITAVRIAAYFIVLVGQFALVVVADGTTEFRVIVHIQVAIRTGVPCSLMFSGVYGEEISVMIIKVGRAPSGSHTVAQGAIRAKIQTRMIHRLRIVVVALMAGNAFRRNVGVAASFVAGCAVCNVMSIGKRKEEMKITASGPAFGEGIVALDTIR